jgi:hypothetical protein
MKNLDNILSKSQHRLRGRKLQDMTVSELNDWIDACNKAEQVVEKKARRGWIASKKEALEELGRRKQV